MFATPFATPLWPQRNFPSEARMPTRPRPRSWTYCFTPAPFEITIEE